MTSAKFTDQQAYQAWIEQQDWYQTIELPSGLKTIGKFPTHRRAALIKSLDLKGKRVLDVGCNSGQYALMAKALGAAEVVGIDVNEKRLEQARTLALNEGYEIDFRHMSLFDIATLGEFDVVFCFAVLTEISDFIGAVEALKKVTGEKLLIEIGCARKGWLTLNPLTWLQSRRCDLPLFQSMAEVRRTKRGVWVLKPSFALLKEIFGSGVILKRRSGGLRYSLIEIYRKKA